MGERKGGARKRKVLALRTAARHLLGSVARAVDLLTRSSLLPSRDVSLSSLSSVSAIHTSSADERRVSPAVYAIMTSSRQPCPSWSSSQRNDRATGCYARAPAAMTHLGPGSCSVKLSIATP